MTFLKLAARITLLASVGILGAASANAQLATYVVSGLSSVATSISATSVTSPFTFSPLTVVTDGGLTNPSTAGTFLRSGWDGTNDYFQFSITGAGTTGVDLSALNFTYVGSSSQSVNALFSVDGGAFLPYGSSNLPATSTSESAGSFTSVSGAVGGSVVVHLVPTASGTFGLSNVAGTDLTVSGSAAAIPEPGSLALIGLSLLPGVALLRRRK